MAGIVGGAATVSQRVEVQIELRRVLGGRPRDAGLQLRIGVRLVLPLGLVLADQVVWDDREGHCKLLLLRGSWVEDVEDDVRHFEPV